MDNEHHVELQHELLRATGCDPDDGARPGNSYLGTTKPCYPLSAAAQTRIVREFKARHSDLSLPAYLALLDSLCQGRTSNDISLAGKLLTLWPALRRQIEPQRLHRWLENVEGWGETDSICQSTFTAAELLARWDEWQALLDNLAIDPNVHKRRASLVLLTGPVRQHDDERLAAQALANIERLKHERDILITKAVSWLLRSLTKLHREKVEEYLEANEGCLPRVAVRETRNKLRTGKKSGQLQ